MSACAGSGGGDEKKMRRKRGKIFILLSYLRVRVEDVEVDSGQVGREHPVDGVAAPAADADDLFGRREG